MKDLILDLSEILMVLFIIVLISALAGFAAKIVYILFLAGWRLI